MSYLMLILLIGGLVAIGVLNFRHTCRTASKLVEAFKND
jgi:hypothetical protein